MLNANRLTAPVTRQRNWEVSLLRSLSIAMPAQLVLQVDPDVVSGEDRWQALPAAAREQVLVLLARLIAREVLAAEEAGR